jgi:hypothetical protein
MSFHPRTNRRTALKGIAAAGLTLGPGYCWSQQTKSAPDGSSGSDWSFTLLGDLHFDRLEHHDWDWVRKHQPNDVRQIENYSRITKEYLPPLLKHVAEQTRTDPTRKFVVQLGDLVEGLCGTPELARRHCREAAKWIDGFQFERPFLITKGNHDITGPGAREAYDEILTPWMRQQTNTAANFERSDNGWKFVFFDSYDRQALDWLEKTLTPADRGKVFVITHLPVVPYNARSLWALYAHPRQQEQRTRLLRLLEDHQAIVLCGHLHKYAWLRRESDTGSFSQLALSSVAYSLKEEPRHLLRGTDHYNGDLVEMEPRHSPANRTERRAFLEKEKPFIREFDYGDFWGSATVRLRKGKAFAEISQFARSDVWRTIKLSG